MDVKDQRILVVAVLTSVDGSKEYTLHGLKAHVPTYARWQGRSHHEIRIACR